MYFGLNYYFIQGEMRGETNTHTYRPISECYQVKSDTTRVKWQNCINSSCTSKMDQFSLWIMYWAEQTKALLFPIPSIKIEVINETILLFGFQTLWGWCSFSNFVDTIKYNVCICKNPFYQLAYMIWLFYSFVLFQDHQ